MNRPLRALSVAALLTACPTITLPDAPKLECTFNSDCAENKICAAGGVCVDECKADRDCPAEHVCAMGACVPKAGSCREDRQCGAGQKCTAQGTCAQACTTPADCGAGFACLDGACVSQTAGCTRDTECPSTQVCGGRGACATPCAADSACEASEQCSAGACVARPTACTADTECAALEACVSGRCLRGCASSSCPGGSRCVNQACEPLPAACAATTDCPTGKACAGQKCVDACVGTRDCRDGLVCSFGACVAPGSGCLIDADCAMGKVCSPNAECVATCTGNTQCATGEVCSNGACLVANATTATVSGTVELAGLTAHAGITVTLRGPSNTRVTTAQAGTYRFEGLKAGRYEAIFSAPSTRETQLVVEVAAGAGAITTVPTQRLTPVGRLRGNVKLQGATSHHGIQVALVGQNLVTTTQPSGDFEFSTVPVGTFQLLATAALYLPVQVMTPAVDYNQVATQGTLTLQPQPVTTGAIFSFVTTPITWAVMGRPYVYTAIAGGGGIAAPTYAVIDGPPGFTIDSGSGAISYTPNTVGEWWIVLSATGGNATVYQIYYLDIERPYQQLVVPQTNVTATVTSGAQTWMLDSTSATLLVDGGRLGDAGVVDLKPHLYAINGSIDSLESLNGATLTQRSYLGGAITSVTGPVGTAQVSWQGGTVGSVTPADRFVVASREELPTITGASVIEGAEITSLSLTQGQVERFTFNRATPAAISAESGLVTDATPQVLTDANASWTASAFTGRCLTNSRGTEWATITANTATTITVSSTFDLTRYFGVDDRYFVISCSTGSTRYTLSQPTAMFGTLTSQRVDLYAAGTALGNFTVTSNTATTITFEASYTSYPDLLTLPQAGFYALGPSSGHTVTLEDPTAMLGAGLSAANRVSFDGINTTYAITGNTATSITFTAGQGTLLRFLPGLSWRLTDTSSRTSVTVGFTGTAFTPSAFVGRALHIDAIGSRFQITANTANSVTVFVDGSQFPLTSWRSSLAAVTAHTSSGPRVRFTSSSALPTQSAGELPAYRVSGIGQSLSIASFGTAERSTSGAVDVRLSLGAFSLRDALTAVGAKIGVGTYGPRLKLTVQGAPGWVPGGLAGRDVSIAATGDTARVGENGASTLWVETTSSSIFTNFSTLQAGTAVILSSTGGTFRATLEPAGGGLTPGALAGLYVVNSFGTSVGAVLSNTATEIELAATNASALAALQSETAYGLANPNISSGCGSPGRIAASGTLAGATLSPNAYQTLELENVSYPVSANTTTTLTFSLCYHQLDELLRARGTLGAAATAGRVVVTLHDTSASFTADGLVGKRLSFFDNGVSRTPPVVANTATSLQLSLVASEFRSLRTRFVAGARFAAADENRVTLTFTTAAALPAGLAPMMAELRTPNGSTTTMAITSNTGTTLVGHISDSYLNSMFPLSGAPVDRVRLSEGAIWRLSDARLMASAGTLVGRQLRINSRDYEIIANAPGSMTFWSADESSYESLRAATSYVVRALSAPRQPALVNGELWVPASISNMPVLMKVTAAGVQSTFSQLSSGRALALKPLPRISGTIASALDNGTTQVLTDPSQNLTPGAHVGDLLVTEDQETQLIVANTATTISVMEQIGLQVGEPYRIVRTRFSVPAGGLTAGELVGSSLRLYGLNYPIRANTANEVQVSIPNVSIYQAQAELLPPEGLTAYAMTGFEGTLNSVRPAATGFNVATSAGVVHYDGSKFTRVKMMETASTVLSGTITTLTTSSVMASTPLTPNALSGKYFVTHAGAYYINSNTNNTINLSSIPYFSLPMPGDSFRVVNTDSFEQARDVAQVGSTLYVATDVGLYTRTGMTWSRITRASTESMPGKGDGLPCDSQVLAVPDESGGLWVSCNDGSPLGRLSGSTWTQYSVASTESAPGKGDGLLTQSVNSISVTPSGVWFGSYAGAARLSGSLWTQHTSSGGMPSEYVYGVVQPMGALPLFITSGGAFVASP